MPLIPPATLTPSKFSTFTDCALSFRLSAIDRLPEPPTVAATRGSLVHLALQYLFDRPPAERTPDIATEDLARAFAAMATDPEYTGLDLNPDEGSRFLADAAHLLRRYFDMEDPTTIHPIGLELKLEAKVGDIRVRGIIDRLELDDAGGLVVTDYKTGRAPGQAYQQGRLGGVAFYALLCEEVFGVRPARVQLLYLGDGTTISTEASDQSTRGLRTRIGAVWSAVERACDREDFRPRPGPLCNYCGFHAYCPAQGGDLALIPSSVADPAPSTDDGAPDITDVTPPIEAAG